MHSSSPAARLGYLHVGTGIAGGEGLESLQAVVEGNRSWWSMRGISGPSAESGDDPCCPGQCAVGIWIVRKLGRAIEALVDDIENLDFIRRKGSGCGKTLAAVAGLDALNDDSCRLGGDGDKLHEPVGGFQLTVLDTQALGFHGSEELLDDPALLVPGDDLPGVLDAGERVG